MTRHLPALFLPIAVALGLAAAFAAPLALLGALAPPPAAAQSSRALPESACTAAISQTITPGSLELCETAEVQVTLALTCPALLPVNVVIAVDRSGSMEDELSGVQRSARDVLDELDWDTAQVKVAVLSHGERVKVEQDFTTERSRANSAVGRIRYDPSDIKENPGGAVDKAVQMFEAERRGNDGTVLSPIEIVILYGDGCDPTENSCRNAASRAASTAQGKGVTVVTVCYDTERASCNDYRAMASEQMYFPAPAGRMPQRIRELQDSGRAMDLSLARLVEVLGPQVGYVSGSGQPAPAVEGAGGAGGAELTFEWSGVAAGDTVTATYEITPSALGVLDVRDVAESRVVLVDDLERESPPLALPEAPLEVTGPCAVETPTPTASPLPTETPTPEASPTPDATATDAPTSSPPPTETPEPSPTPGTYEAWLPVALVNVCQKTEQRTDVSLAIDASGSMQESAGAAGTKLDAAKQAATVFVDLLEPGDQAAVVSFSEQARIEAPLGGDAEALRAAIAGIASSPGTRIDRALRSAAEALDGPGARPGNSRAIILLTDGRTNPPATADDARRAAADAKAAGATIFTIGLGGDVDADFLREIASGPALYYEAPTADDLEEIYRAIAGELPCPGGAIWPPAAATP